jgi:hypothetical protein
VNAYIHTEKATVRIDDIGPIDMPAPGDPWLVIQTADGRRTLAVVSLTDGTFVTIGDEDPAKAV